MEISVPIAKNKLRLFSQLGFQLIALRYSPTFLSQILMTFLQMLMKIYKNFDKIFTNLY